MTTMVELLDGILTDSRFRMFLWYFSPCSSREIQWISTGFHFAQQEQGEKYHKNTRDLESVKMPSSNSNMVVTMTPFTFNKNQYFPLELCKTHFFHFIFLVFLSDLPTFGISQSLTYEDPEKHCCHQVGQGFYGFAEPTTSPLQ